MRIVIADDHLIIRRGLQLIISRLKDWTIAAEAETVEQLEDVLSRGRYDILITDVRLRNQNMLEVVTRIRRERPALPILVLTSEPEAQYAIAALRAGARGYIEKDASSDEIIDAIKRVASGRQSISDAIVEQMTGELSGGAVHLRLSTRELDVFVRLARGETPTEIGNRLGISVKTVSTYRARIMEKAGFRSNAEMTAYAIRERLLK